MLINGIPVRDELVGQLAAFLRLDDHSRTAERIERGAKARPAEVRLDVHDVDALFGAIDQCPDDEGLLELRAKLLAQHDARLRGSWSLASQP